MKQMRSEPGGGPTAVLLAAVLAALPVQAALAQSPGVSISPPRSGNPAQENMPRSWYRNYDYGIEIDGERNPSIGLYQVVGKPYMLVYGPGLDPAWVLSMRPKEVRPIPSGEITVKTDMEVVLTEASFSAAKPSPWAQDGQTAVVFYGGSRRIRVGRVPPLIGETTLDAIMEQNPMYRRGMEKYVPEQGAIARLKKVSRPFEIEVWFGSWCPHCQRVVPRFIKVMQVAANPNVQVSYHGVPRQFSEYRPAMDKEVYGLPTFIVMRDGREYKRFKGSGERISLEEELAQLLASGSES